MATKEVMVTAPLLVLLYDRLFVAPSWREIWRARSRFYLSLMLLGWITLAAVLLRTNGSNLGNVQALFLQLGDGKSGVWGGHEIHWYDYARMQIWAVARYFRLSFGRTLSSSRMAAISDGHSGKWRPQPSFCC